MLVRTLVLALGLAMSHAASAQTLPRPSEFYFDNDTRALKPLMTDAADSPAAIDRMLKKIERDATPRAVPEMAHLAHLAMEGGRVETGRDLYMRALARIDRSHPMWRPVVWNYAWDLYRAGDAPEALNQWAALHSSGRLQASWIPTTYALALWTVGRRDEAVQWYAAAVRTQPGDWSGTGSYARLLPDWRETERATLAEVQAAWAANPPTWP